MHRQFITEGYRPVLLGFAALLGTAMAGSASAQERGAHNEDSRICASFGVGHESSENSDCMLTQQRRRDDAPLRAAEQQRLSVETARSKVEMVRGMRYEGEAKREHQRGERPRLCH
jgi:hypothetical protein